jgi:hypothetical protein
MGCNQDAGLQNCKMGAFVLRCVSGVACDLGRKMSAAQQAAAIPIEALKFSTRFNDKLTGGASSLSFQPKSGTTEAEGETEGSAQGGDAGPLVESEAVLAQVLSYDPLLIHKTEPWRRALVNDDAFDLESKVAPPPARPRLRPCVIGTRADGMCWAAERA